MSLLHLALSMSFLHHLSRSSSLFRSSVVVHMALHESSSQRRDETLRLGCCDICATTDGASSTALPRLRFCDCASATALLRLRFCHGTLRLRCCHLASVIAPTAAAATVLRRRHCFCNCAALRLPFCQCHSATAVPATAVLPLRFHDGASATALPRLRFCHCALQ